MRHTSCSVALLCLAACGGSEMDSLEWGVGAKADEVCSETAALCWGPTDIDSIQAIGEVRFAVGLGEISEADGAAAIGAYLRSLSHKLTAAELAELDDLEERPSWSETAALAERLEAAQLTAHAVLLGRALEFAAKGDETSSDEEDQVPGDELKTDAERSLENLKRTNVAGRVYGTMIGASGVHRHQYSITDRANFSPNGPSREEQVEKIIAQKAAAAGLVGVGAGTINLIPGAGIFLSIPLETVGLFNLHARMAFSIAAAYGWDIHTGDNLKVVALALLTDGELDSLDDELEGIPQLPALIRAIGRELGLPVTSTLAVRLTASAIAYAVRISARKAAALAGKAAALKVGEKALGQVLNWATLGLGVLAAGAADWYITNAIGEHVALLTRPWLIDLPIEGTQYLRTASRRACYVNALGAIANADGSINASEEMMIETLLEKPYYLGNESWISLDSSEKTDLRTRFDAPSTNHRCLSVFEDEETRRKLIIFSHFFGMAAIDQAEATSEAIVVLDFVDRLDGRGFFDGPKVKELHIRFVKGAVTRSLNADYDLLDW